MANAVATALTFNSLKTKQRAVRDGFSESAYANWSKYESVGRLGWRFNDVKATGCYELARYWCLIEKLADGRTATLVNLGLPALFTGVQGDRLDRFVAALDTSEQRRFQKVTWTELLAPILPKAEDWFVQFCRDDRKLLSP